MPVGRLKSENASFGMVSIQALPVGLAYPGAGGRVWRELETYTYVTLHRLHLILEASFGLKATNKYQWVVGDRTYSPGTPASNSKTKYLIDWLMPRVQKPAFMTYRRAEGDLKILLGDKEEARDVYPQLVSADGAWPGPGEPDFDLITERLKAMQPLDDPEKGSDRLLIKSLPDGSLELGFGPRNWDFLMEHWEPSAPRTLKCLVSGGPKGGTIHLDRGEELEELLKSLDLASGLALNSRIQDRLDDLAQSLEDLSPLLKGGD